jgi:hypothetical protein
MWGRQPAATTAKTDFSARDLLGEGPVLMGKA